MTEKQRAERILANLAAVNDDLRAFVNDVGRSIDFNDKASKQAGNEFLDNLDPQLDAFQVVSDNIAALIQKRHGISDEAVAASEAGRQTTPSDAVFVNRRAHHLGEDFTHTKPSGVTLGTFAFADLYSWRGVLVALCRHLREQNPGRFAALPDNPKFVTQQNYHMFASSLPHLSKEHKMWRFVGPEMYVYVNLSANDTCIRVSKLLSEFSIPESALAIYLQQERDSVGSDVA